MPFHIHPDAEGIRIFHSASECVVCEDERDASAHRWPEGAGGWGGPCPMNVLASAHYTERDERARQKDIAAADSHLPFPDPSGECQHPIRHRVTDVDGQYFCFVCHEDTDAPEREAVTS